MPHLKRVAVLSAAFCIQMECKDCECTHLGGKQEYVDCRRRDCDNHKRGCATFPAVSETPPFELPLSGESVDAPPSAPE